jgi:hypothetical protein
MALVYDKGFSNPNFPPNIIGTHDKKIKDLLLPQLSENDIFIDTTWITLSPELLELIQLSKEESKRIVCYSGADWNNTYGPPFEHHSFSEVYDAMGDCNVIHIGNSLGKYYFSFWLDFIYSNIEQYDSFDTFEFIKPIKHFMCLNRKPHRHRFEMVRDLIANNLMPYGYVSCGGTPIEGTHLPIVLDTDITNEDGDTAVSGDVGITNDINSLGHISNWNSHAVNIVTETTTYTDVFITEKTFKPILGKRPFMILGDRNIYKLLQDWGFDTFDDLFGDGYNLPDYHDRIEWITSNIKKLLYIDNLEDFLISLRPRLENNYQQFFKIAKINRNNISNILDK